MTAKPSEPGVAQPDLTRERFSTPVQFTEGMLGRPKSGEIGYDGLGRVTLTAADGRTVVSATMVELGKVRRAESALYLKASGKTYCVIFGDLKRYALETGALAQGGILGAYLSQKRGRKLNENSSLEKWVLLFKQSGVMGLNASPEGIWKNFFVKPMKWILILGAVVVAIALLTSR